MLEAGSIVGGKFRIERILGSGGMGQVAVATHLQLEQKVALKVLLDQLASDRDTVERFLREARASARLRSEHVCKVSDVGQLESGAPYMVMELLAGRDLAATIHDAPLTVATAADYVVQACIAIAEAHANRIVHRDLKPANLFVTHRLDGSPLIKVLDFGIAKAPQQTATALTETHAVMGTPGYMAPEQLRSARDVDARADQWALGVILYQAVSGRLPFVATSITEMAVKIAIDDPEPLDVDPAFRAIVLRCLEKEPAKRYRDVAELAEALAPLAGAQAPANAALARKLLAGTDHTLPSGGLSAQLAAAPSSAQPPPVATTLAIASGQAAPQRSRKGLAIGGGLVVLGGVVAMLIATRSHGDAPAAAAPHDTPAPVVAAQPAPAAPPSTALPAGAPPLDAEHRLADALAKHHCHAATGAAHELVGTHPEVAKQVADCVKKQQNALGHPEDPASEPWVVGMGEEIVAEGGVPAQAQRLLETHYSARVAAACRKKDLATARALFAKIKEPAMQKMTRDMCLQSNVMLE